MNCKNNFDLTEHIVGPVSSLTWHNTNNNQNAAQSYAISSKISLGSASGVFLWSM